MSKYSGTYLECGHEGIECITGPKKNREYIKERRFASICPECYKKLKMKELEESQKVRNSEIAEINKKADSETKEMELPALSGSEKQIAWANTIRINFIHHIETMMNKCEDLEYRELSIMTCRRNYKLKIKEDFLEHLNILLQYAILNKTAAKYWIESNNSINEREPYTIIVQLSNEYQADKENGNIIIDEDSRLNTVVSPEQKVHNGIVDIKGNDKKITLLYDKNDTFIELVRSMGYKWHNAWERELNEHTGNFSDRVAEIGNVLLMNGFSIRIIDDIIRENAVNGIFNLEHKRWIGLSDSNCFEIFCKEDETEVRKNAKKISGAKEYYRYILVPSVDFESVSEFAEMYNFYFTDKAGTFLKARKEEMLRAKVVTPIPSNKEYDSIDKLKGVLTSSFAILEDLADE